MSVKHSIYRNLYRDSVTLMTVSAAAAAVPGVSQASVVMMTGANVAQLAEAGLGDFLPSPNDLVVAVRGTDDACDTALAAVADALRGSPGGGAAGGAAQEPPSSIELAVRRDPAHNLALISVPGDYAAAEAMKALRLGLDVMIFSDNVAPELELRIKQYADSLGLMVMGPDCGTAIVHGIPLGFANACRRGPIGVVGASGTGIQEVTSRVHQLGSGISHALGAGGRDLSERIGGISTLHGLAALAADPGTAVIVLVSKPPAPHVAKQVLSAAAAVDKPVVVVFLGAPPEDAERAGVVAVRSLAQAADVAVGLVRGQQLNAVPAGGLPPADLQTALHHMAPGRRYLRGVYSGGTFCYEAQLVCRDAGITTHSTTPATGNGRLAAGDASEGNTIIDMGDDAFTRGRPHPMIDPRLRDDRIRAQAQDPHTAVVVFDVVLGWGAADDPIGGLLPIIRASRAEANGAVFIAHVCGTDLDRQGRDRVVADLTAAGVLVAGSNAEAAAWAAAVVSARSTTEGAPA